MTETQLENTSKLGVGYINVSDRYLASIAISMKRIADVLDNNPTAIGRNIFDILASIDKTLQWGSKK